MTFSQAMKNLKDFLNQLPMPVVALGKILGIIILSILIVKIGSHIIRKTFEKQKLFKHGMAGKKIDTMGTLSASIFRYSVYIVAVITILTNVLNFTSILAAAGIGGIALGLGAQSLIRDVISGFFIVVEDQFVVGDMITIENMTGTVEELELRVTRLRNFNGDLYIIPNGEIKKLTNHTRGNKAVMVDVPISYSADLSKAFQMANGVCAKVSEEFTTITEAPRVLGVTDLGKEGLNLRIIAKTLPNEHWEVERRIRALIKEGFDAAGVSFTDRYRWRTE